MNTKSEKTLDVCASEALAFLAYDHSYKLQLPDFSMPLVTGSQNGYLTGVQLYKTARKAFTHGREVDAMLHIDAGRIDGVTIVTATGTRDVIPIAGRALERKIPVRAITCAASSPLLGQYGSHKLFSATVLSMEDAPVHPQTTNIATYGKMLMGVSGENPARIGKLIDEFSYPDLSTCRALTVIFPDSMSTVSEMVDWKIRGENIARQAPGMATYVTNFMHGASVIDSPGEHYVAIGLDTEESKTLQSVLPHVHEKRLHMLDVPQSLRGPLAYMMAGYAVVGKFQQRYPAFLGDIAAYVERSRNFIRLGGLR
jgi:hypothetical protein